MSIESYNLVEHFDYMTKYIPQPFYISSDSFVEFQKIGDEYVIKLKECTYNLSKPAAKKFVDSLGIKLKLFSNDDNAESCVIEQVMPAINKLFKCFAECFVFYLDNDESLSIIDLNVNPLKGEEGTKYENGPSPWTYSIKDEADLFTCFTHFMDKYVFDSEVLVEAKDIMTSTLNVSLSLFKPVTDTPLQPMLLFNGKCSDMNGFSEIHPALYDTETNTYIVYPMNYAKNDSWTFEDMWKQVLHLNDSISLDDYIYREVNELAASNDVPNSIKSFISTLLVENTLNINQPIVGILHDANDIANGLKPAKAKKFKTALGNLIGFCFVAKHYGCHECGSIHLI